MKIKFNQYKIRKDEISLIFISIPTEMTICLLHLTLKKH
jgi:hypothetical protein